VNEYVEATRFFEVHGPYPEIMFSDFFLTDQPCEIVKRPVEGALRICGENAGGKLPEFQMIAYAVAAGPLARTGIVGAVT
jgi:hypothetical protein